MWRLKSNIHEVLEPWSSTTDGTAIQTPVHVICGQIVVEGRKNRKVPGECQVIYFISGYKEARNTFFRSAIGMRLGCNAEQIPLRKIWEDIVEVGGFESLIYYHDDVISRSSVRYKNLLDISSGCHFSEPERWLTDYNR